jgi:hypothetical protein
MGLFDIIGQFIGLKSTPNQKLDLSQSAASAGLPIIYGHRKVEAITVLKRVSEYNAPQAQNSVDDYVYRGDQGRDSKRNYKNWLHRIDVWGQGPIEDIVRFWIDDDPHTHNRFGSKRPYFRAASMFGAETQTALTALKTAVPEWSNAHKGNGVAYSWSRFFNSTQFPQFRGEPKLEAEIKGVRLYDPRKDTSLGGTGSHDYDDPSTWQYGNNRALTLLNYLMGPYGLNAPKDEVDLESFIVAADICDQDLPIPPPRTNDTDNPVDVPDPNTGDTVTVQPGQPYPQYRPYQAGDTQKRFVTDAVIDPQQDVVGNVKSLLEEFGWSLSWSNGKHKLVLEIEDILPVATFDANTILGGWSIERGNRADRYNRITVRFKNQNRHFSEDTVSWPPLDSVIYNGTGEPDDNGYLDQDGGRALHTDITLATVTDYYRAQRVAELKVEKSRIGERIKGLQLAPEAMLLEPGDVIALNYPEKGYVTTGDPQIDDLFIVENIQVSSTLDVSVDLTRYDSRIYPLTNTDQEPLSPPGSGFNPFDEPGAVTNLNAIEYHTNKADGSVISGIYLTWDTTISAIPVERVEVKWRDIADAELAATDDYAGTISLPPEATACRIPDLVDNRQYRVVVSYKTRLSQRSIEAVYDPVDLRATTVSKLDTIEDGATRTEFRGPYNSGAFYERGDIVTFKGSSYVFISTIPATGTVVANPTYWELLASVGAEGAAGSNGGFFDIMFRRSISQPATPTDSAPVEWSDGPPAADGNPLWIIKGLKSAEDELIGAWSIPQEIGGSGLEVEYSVSGSSGWHSTFQASDLYMRQRLAGGSWSAAIRVVGEKGDDGPTGPRGPSGATWHRGSSAPSSSLGSIGDFYYRYSNGNIYVKTGSSTWSLDGNIMGDDGADGDRWHSGVGAPSGSLGTIGDFYLRTSTNQVYEKTGSSTWIVNFSLTDSLGALAALDDVGTGNIRPGAVSDSNSTTSNANHTNLPEGTLVSKGSVGIDVYNSDTDQVVIFVTFALVVYTGRANVEIFIKNGSDSKMVAYITEQRHTIGGAQKTTTCTAQARFIGDISSSFQTQFKTTFLGSGGEAKVTNVRMTALVMKR